DIDDLYAMLHRDLGILDRRDAFQDERKVVLVLVSLYLIPRQPGLEASPFDRAGAPWLDEAPATAVGGDVHREAERLEAVVLGAAHEVVGPGIIAAHVELEYAHVVGG